MGAADAVVATPAAPSRIEAIHLIRLMSENLWLKNLMQHSPSLFLTHANTWGQRTRASASHLLEVIRTGRRRGDLITRPDTNGSRVTEATQRASCHPMTVATVTES